MNPNLLYDVAAQYHSERLASAERRRLIRSLRPPTRSSLLHRLLGVGRKVGVQHPHHLREDGVTTATNSRWTSAAS